MHTCLGFKKKKLKQNKTNLLKSCYLKYILIIDVETDGASSDTERLAVPHVLQWMMTGQSHIPIPPDEKNKKLKKKKKIKITLPMQGKAWRPCGVLPNSECMHADCDFSNAAPIIMSEAVQYGGGFHRVKLSYICSLKITVLDFFKGN